MPSVDPYLGSVDLAGYNHPSARFAVADGTLIPYSQNSALASLFGTTFGGVPWQTFGLPDLRGRMPMGTGQGSHPYGQKGGVETQTLLVANLPAHAHQVSVSLGGTVGAGSHPAASSDSTATAGTADAATTPTGGGLPFSILPPYLVLPYLVSLRGSYPVGY